MANNRRLTALSVKFLSVTDNFKVRGVPYPSPDSFINLSMEALQIGEYDFKFPYRIRNKESKQCIALELLGREMFPEELIQSAIKMKNRLSDVDDK